MESTKTATVPIAASTTPTEMVSPVQPIATTPIRKSTRMHPSPMDVTTETSTVTERWTEMIATYSDFGRFRSRTLTAAARLGFTVLCTSCAGGTTDDTAKTSPPGGGGPNGGASSSGTGGSSGAASGTGGRSEGAGGSISAGAGNAAGGAYG